MASLKEIKTRMASVQSTRKITSAMKMVASSKLHHAQNAIENMLPYEAMLEHILKTFLVSTPNTDTQFDVQRPVKRVALLVFSSSSSLCGGFNANVIKLLMQVVDEYHSKGLTNEDIVIYPIGSECGVFTAYRTENGIECNRGCFSGTIEEFEKAVKKTHGENKYSKEYKKVIELVKLRLGE